MRKFACFLLFFALAASMVREASAVVYVSRIGDGSAFTGTVPSPGADASAVFIDKYSDAGALLQTIPMPTAAFSGSGNHPLTLPAVDTAMGHLSLSLDGQYLLLGGADAVPGTVTVRQTTTGRDIGLINVATAAVDTTTSTTDTYPGSTNNNNMVRQVIGPNSTQLYMSGTSFPSTVTGGGSNGMGGLQYVPYGSTTGSIVDFGPTNLRNVAFFNGDIYGSSATTTATVPHSFIGIAKMASAAHLPPANDEAADADFSVLFSTAITGSGSASPYAFWIKDANTVYVADDRQGSAGGGIQKWTTDPLDAGNDPGSCNNGWCRAYTLTPPDVNNNTGARGLFGTTDGSGHAVLYATTSIRTGPNEFTTSPLLSDSVVKITDTGAASTFTTLATSGANQIFRGVVFIPAPAGLTGDYNNDGKVDAADYVLWRKTPGSFGGDPAGYTAWRANFGTGGPGAGLGAGAVPEPTSVALLVLGLVALGCRQKRS
jgi:hypothetical protein